MRLVDAEFEEKHYLSMIDSPTPDVSENDRKTALAIVKAFRLASTVGERKTGKWIEEQAGLTVSGHCSACGWECYLYEDDVVGMPYCPNCGAKMEGVES